MGTLIEAKNIHVFRHKKHILDDVSVHIGERDFITIIGPNGAGKSMLLKCLIGFYEPNRGSIQRQPGLRIGYVPQRLTPHPSMPITVHRFLSLRKRTTETHLQRIVQETHIEKFLESPLSTLSGGELQRVLLARSLLVDPQLLILDEISQNLDITRQVSFYRLLEQIYEEHELSILMVSHDLHMVLASTQRVICLFHHVCCSGEPQAVTKDPQFISLFGDDMAEMMAIYQHSHDKHQHHEHT